MAQVTIDGKALEFSPGESVIQAATRQDIEIPHYCWHPRLSIAANCRMCLVEVEKAPKLVPACQTECKDGMVVHTANDKVRQAQRSVSEFLLVNHPIDCPICDQAGECKLQDYYMKFQLAPSRMREAKVRKRKLQRLGPHVTYDAERCIVCTRCVRFMEEVPKDRQLGVFNRGDHSVIGTAPGQPLDNPYALNTVDVCPVGALTSNVFRFKQRVWNLKRSPSVCPGCAKGCNVHVDQRASQVYRLLPRENEAVNKSWMCDEGRLTYNRANENRLG
ncbi:MAG: 2Fe-2S iron-sulfur cluster binding domain-containing protein, partial [Deltaproteobacteria bacterium]